VLKNSQSTQQFEEGRKFQLQHQPSSSVTVRRTSHNPELSIMASSSPRSQCASSASTSSTTLSSFHHQPGTAIECLSIPITLRKEGGQLGEPPSCGFKIGGGIDQDYRRSPQGYSDNVSELPASMKRSQKETGPPA